MEPDAKRTGLSLVFEPVVDPDAFFVIQNVVPHVTLVSSRCDLELVPDICLLSSTLPHTGVFTRAHVLTVEDANGDSRVHCVYLDPAEETESYVHRLCGIYDLPNHNPIRLYVGRFTSKAAAQRCAFEWSRRGRVDGLFTSIRFMA